MAITDAVSPAPRDVWEELLAHDPDAVCEQSPLWIDAMAAAGGFDDASRLYRFADGRRFVLPMVRRLRAPAPRSGFGTGWGIGGIVGDSLDGGAVSEIVGDLAADRSVYTHIRPNPLQASSWFEAETRPAHAIARRAHVVDLAGGVEATRDRFRKSGKRGIRRAEREGVEITTHLGGEMLPLYYDALYLPAIERWAQRQHEPAALARFRASRRDPLRKLEAIARSLGTSFRLYMAWVDGEPAAGNAVLWGPRNAHATRGALNYALASRTKAGYLADWVAIKDACEAGFSWYQMGESGQNRTLADYKERFGAVPLDYCEYRLERLPLLAVDTAMRGVVKRVIGFKDS